MKNLESILDTVIECSDCLLMEDNNYLNIPFVPILPKPTAKVVFIGRDPSPRTASVVGKRGGKSVFINEIFNVVDSADVNEENIYITDLMKCHWRTSVGKPIPGTENRSNKINLKYANMCMTKWLFQEIEILNPKLIIIFGEELYQILKRLIINPIPPPQKLSAKEDKSVMDGEFWFVKNGCFTVKINKEKYSMAVLRHPGNSFRLPKNKKSDHRWEFFQKSRERLVTLINNIGS